MTSATSDDDGFTSLAEAASLVGLSTATLRRLCAAGVVAARRSGRRWLVRLKDAQRYVVARPPRGAGRVGVDLTGPALGQLAEAPNPTLRDAYGWKFDVALRGRTASMTVWVSRDLYVMLTDEGRDPRELVMRARDGLVLEALLDGETLPTQIILKHRDRARLLRAAGFGSIDFRPAEAPNEPGVVVLYDFTARDRIWPGDHHAVSADCCDAYVTCTPDGGRRRVRAVRLPRVSLPTKRREVLAVALRAYRARSKHLGVRTDEWADQLGDLVRSSRRRAT